MPTLDELLRQAMEEGKRAAAGLTPIRVPQQPRTTLGVPSLDEVLRNLPPLEVKERQQPPQQLAIPEQKPKAPSVQFEAASEPTPHEQLMETLQQKIITPISEWWRTNITAPAPPLTPQQRADLEKRLGKEFVEAWEQRKPYTPPAPMSILPGIAGTVENLIRQGASETLTGQPPQEQVTTGHAWLDQLLRFAGGVGGFATAALSGQAPSAVPTPVAGELQAAQRLAARLTPQIENWAARIAPELATRLPLARLTEAATFGGISGATRAVAEAKEPKELVTKAPEEAAREAATMAVFDLVAAPVSRLLAQTAEKGIKAVRVRFGLGERPSGFEVVKDIAEPKTADYFRKRGYVEFKPGSGLWVLYDDQGRQIEHGYEIVYRRGQPVRKYDMWRENQRRQAAKTTKKEVPTRKITPVTERIKAEPLPLPGEVEAPTAESAVRAVEGALEARAAETPAETTPAAAAPAETVPAVSSRAEVAGREPWQMTYLEYARYFPARSGSYRETLENHRRAVEQALAEGKPVPEEVLADYPDLRPAAETTSATASTEPPRAVVETPAVRPEAPEVPKTVSVPVSPGVGGTYTVRIVKSTGSLKDGQEFTGTVRRIYRAKSGAVLAEVELLDGTKKNIPVSKYAEWYPVEAVSKGEARVKSSIASEAEMSVSQVMPVGRHTVYRRDTSKADLSASKRPQGLYLSLVEDKTTFKTPHEEVGDTDYWGTVRPKNPLIAEPIWVEHARFRPMTRGPASAGVAALKKLLPEEEFNKVLKMNKQELLELLKRDFPGYDYDKYAQEADAYALLEAYAAQLARKMGYDAIIQIDPQNPEFSELVALKDDIVEINPQSKTTVESRTVSKAKTPISQKVPAKEPWQMAREEYAASVEPVNRLTANAADLAADYKARGMDRQRAWSQFIIDRNLRPEMNAKDFYKIYDRVTPKLLEAKKVETKPEAVQEIPAVSPEYARHGEPVEIKVMVGRGKYEWRPAIIDRVLKNQSGEDVFEVIPEGADSSVRVKAENVRPLTVAPKTEAAPAAEMAVSAEAQETVPEVAAPDGTTVATAEMPATIKRSLSPQEAGLTDREIALVKQVALPPATFYRGISKQEFDYILKEGTIKSAGEYNLPGEEDRTLLASDYDTARDYATSFAPEKYRKKFFEEGEPAYIIEIENDPALAIGKNRHELGNPRSKILDSYWATKKPIPTKRIRSVTELRYDKETGAVTERKLSKEEIERLGIKYEPVKARPERVRVIRDDAGNLYFELIETPGKPTGIFTIPQFVKEGIPTATIDLEAHYKSPKATLRIDPKAIERAETVEISREPKLTSLTHEAPASGKAPKLAIETPETYGMLVGAAAQAVTPGEEKPAGELRAYRGQQATVQAAQPAANQVQKLQILRILENRFNVPLRTGRLRIRSALGEYSTRENVIKTKVQADLPVIAHELGHRLQKLLNFDLQQLASSREIMGLGQAVARKGAQPVEVAEEGLAEFVRLFISEPDRGQSKASNFYAEFVNALNQQGHEEIRDALLEAWGLYQTWFGQDPVSRVAGHIVGQKAAETKHWLTAKERVYTKLADSGYPILKAVQEALGGTRIARWRGKAGIEDLPYIENPYILYRLAAGRWAKIDRFLTEEITSPDLSQRMPGLKKILEPVREYINPLEKPEDQPGLFQAYLTARRAVELHGREISTGITPEDAEYTVRLLEREHPEFKDVAEQLYVFQDMVIDHLVDAGVLAREAAEKMRAVNRAYVPFRRFFEEEAFSPKAGGGRKTVDLPSGVKTIRGSERLIYDPVESIVGNTMYLLDLAERNKVGRALARLAGKVEGFGKLMYRVPQPLQPVRMEVERIRGVLQEAGVDPNAVDLESISTTFVPVMRTYGKAAREGVAWIWEDGKPTFWRMHPDLYQALQAFDEQTIGTIEWALGGPVGQLATRLLRGGAVLTPEFAGRNMVRDILHSMTMGAFHPLNFVEGLFHVIRRDDLYSRFINSGAAQSAWLSFDRDYGTKNVREITGKLTPLQKAKRIVVTPIEALRLIGETAEEATRTGAFARVEREALAKGVPEEEARARAAYTAREISVDFGRSGVISRRLNRYNVFFNAAIQGADRVWREFKANPLTFGLKGLLYITVPSIILYLINRNDGRWQRLPRYVRDLNWTIPTEHGFVLIPKPFEVGVIFGTLPERLLEHFAERDPDAFDEFAKRAWDVFTPSIIPTVMAPWIEARANRSLFTGLPIIPEREKKLAPEEQYDIYTSPLSVMLGHVFKVPPRYVDNYVRGYTGGLGMHVWKFLSFLTQKAGLAESVPLPERTDMIPLVRGFYYEGRPGRGNVDRFYELYNRLEQQYYTAREKQKRGEQVTPQDVPNMVVLGYLRRVEKRFQDIRAARRTIEFDRNLTPEQKRRALDWLDQQQEALAQAAVNLAERGGVR